MHIFTSNLGVVMGNNRAGAILHRFKLEQERIDDEIDRQLEKEPVGVKNPVILKNGARLWIFKGVGKYACIRGRLHRLKQ